MEIRLIIYSHLRIKRAPFFQPGQETHLALRLTSRQISAEVTPILFQTIHANIRQLPYRYDVDWSDPHVEAFRFLANITKRIPYKSSDFTLLATHYTRDLCMTVREARDWYDRGGVEARQMLTAAFPRLKTATFVLLASDVEWTGTSHKQVRKRGIDMFQDLFTVTEIRSVYMVSQYFDTDKRPFEVREPIYGRKGWKEVTDWEEKYRDEELLPFRPSQPLEHEYGVTVMRRVSYVPGNCDVSGPEPDTWVSRMRQWVQNELDRQDRG